MKRLTMLNKINNKTLSYLFTLTSYPLLLYLLTMLIYILLSLYFFADPVLCQGEITEFSSNVEEVIIGSEEVITKQDLNLEELINVLDEETIKYNQAMKELDYLGQKMDAAEQAKEYNVANHYDFKSECKADDICDILAKIRDIEEDIKEKDPSFRSSIETPEFAL